MAVAWGAAMRVPRIFLSVSLSLLGALACAGKTKTSAFDSERDSPTPTIGALTCGRTSGSDQDRCVDESACCIARYGDDDGPEGYRCRSGRWTRDPSCDPPPPPCEAPLQGSISSTNGKVFTITCFGTAGGNGEFGVGLALGTGDTMELYLDHLPIEGQRFAVVPYAKRSAFSAGGDTDSSGRVAIRIGRPGGFAGFHTWAESTTGTLDIEGIQTEGTTDAGNVSLRMLRGKLDVELAEPAFEWRESFSGSW